jgi:ribonuclease HI
MATPHNQRQKRRASLPLERQTHSHSYRHELETFYLALKDAADVLTKPHHITQYMDCEAALTALALPPQKPSHNMVTDADLIMARAHLKSIIPHTVTEKWVLGHASEKKKHAPETITSLERDNSECDADAEECIQSGIPPSSFSIAL